MTAAKNSANQVNNKFKEILQALKTNTRLSNPATNAEHNSKCCNDYAQFSLCSVTASEIEHVVVSLPQSAFMGIDSISMSMLKKSPASIYTALTMILNNTLVSGMYPLQWKEALVVPIHKKGRS